MKKYLLIALSAFFAISMVSCAKDIAEEPETTIETRATGQYVINNGPNAGGIVRLDIYSNTVNWTRTFGGTMIDGLSRMGNNLFVYFKDRIDWTGTTDYVDIIHENGQVDRVEFVAPQYVVNNGANAGGIVRLDIYSNTVNWTRTFGGTMIDGLSRMGNNLFVYFKDRADWTGTTDYVDIIHENGQVDRVELTAPQYVVNNGPNAAGIVRLDIYSNTVNWTRTFGGTMIDGLSRMGNNLFVYFKDEADWTGTTDYVEIVHEDGHINRINF